MFNQRESENMETQQATRQHIPNAAPLASLEKKVPQQFPPLAQETRSHITTAHAAFLLGRQCQTLRIWSCYETKGPLRPVRVNGRLAWPVSEIKRVLFGSQK